MTRLWMCVAALSGTIAFLSCDSGKGNQDGGASGGGGKGGTGGDSMGGGGAGTGGGGGGGQCTNGPSTCGYKAANTRCAISSTAPPDTIPPETTTCTSMPTTVVQDSCGCNGLTCPTGSTCQEVYYRPVGGVSRPGGWANSCFTPCTATTDCGPGKQCLANEYGVFECRDQQCSSDSDCRGDSCGHCAPRNQYTHGGGFEPLPAFHVCIYDGACAPGSCAGCADFGVEYGPGNFHFCSGG